jgi:hypothetical protein
MPYGAPSRSFSSPEHQPVADGDADREGEGEGEGDDEGERDDEGDFDGDGDFDDLDENVDERDGAGSVGAVGKADRTTEGGATTVGRLAARDDLAVAEAGTDVRTAAAGLLAGVLTLGCAAGVREGCESTETSSVTPATHTAMTHISGTALPVAGRGMRLRPPGLTNFTTCESLAIHTHPAR